MLELQCPEYRSPYITNKGGSETTLTLQYLGSNDLRLLVSDRAVYSGCAHDRRAGNRYPLASGRLSLLLALEIASACRSAERNAGNSAADPGDEPIRSGVLPASMENSSSSASMSARPQSPSTWRGEGALRRKAGERSFSTMPTGSPQSTCVYRKPCMDGARGAREKLTISEALN